jgi:reactive intermediate/imine deaminase
MRTLPALFCVVLAFGAEKKVVVPPNSRPPIGPFSPGILTADTLYVSGQGAARDDGSFPSTVEEQTAQTLRNVQRIVEAAGLTMEHVVYTHVYLKDVAGYDGMHRAWRAAFPRNAPARATLGVTKMPTDTPVEITAVAVREPGRKKPVGIVTEGVPAGVLAGDRVYLSGNDAYGATSTDDAAADVKAALDRMASTLKAAGLDFRHVVFVNPYLTDRMPMDVMNKVYAWGPPRLHRGRRRGSEQAPCRPAEEHAPKCDGEPLRLCRRYLLLLREGRIHSGAKQWHLCLDCGDATAADHAQSA